MPRTTAVWGGSANVTIVTNEIEGRPQVNPQAGMQRPFSERAKYETPERGISIAAVKSKVIVQESAAHEAVVLGQRVGAEVPLDPLRKWARCGPIQGRECFQEWLRSKMKLIRK